MNKYSAIGNLTEKPTLRSTNSTGKAVCNMRIAVNEDFKDENGEKKHKVEFVNATAWGDLATSCSILEKGSQIYFAGALRTSTWDRNIKAPNTGEEVKVPTESKYISLSEVIFLNASKKNAIQEDTEEIEPDLEIPPMDDDGQDYV